MVVFKKIKIVVWSLFFLQASVLICCERSTITTIKSNTFCPFAKHAQILQNRFSWNDSKTIAENVTAFIAKDLHRFVTEGTKEGAILDALALEIPAKYAKNIATFAAVFRKVLTTINKDCIEQLKQLQPDSNGVFWDNSWRFTYNGKELFVIGLAPLYDEKHPRYTYGAKNAVILFQPEVSFERCLPKDDNARLKKRQRIRDNFTKKGQQYAPNKILVNLELRKETHYAPRFLKPLQRDDKPIKWWNIEKYPGGIINGD